MNMEAKRAKEYPGAKQKLLVTQAKVMLSRKKPRLAKLKQDIFCLEKFIYNSELNTAARKQNLSKGWQEKLKYGQKHKKNVLKAVMEVQ